MMDCLNKGIYSGFAQNGQICQKDGLFNYWGTAEACLFFLLFQYCSISSSVLPFVSGISFQVIHIAGAHKTAKVQKVAAGPQWLLFSIVGVSWPTKKFPIQRDKVARDIARPLTALGKISLIMIQHTGPKEKAKQAINSKIKISIQGPPVILRLNKTPMINRAITAPEIPVISNGFLPHLSTV